MNEISLVDYQMGLAESHPEQWTPDIAVASIHTLDKINRLLAAYRDMTGDQTERRVTMGWRPLSFDSLKDAVPYPAHNTGHGIAVYDKFGDLDDWCAWTNPRILEVLDIYLEHPYCTRGYTRIQTVPMNRFARRVFTP